MMNMPALKTLVKLFFLSALILLTACHKTAEKNKNALTVGTISGPETELMVVAKAVAHKKYGLEITIIPFTDYAVPNEALADGSIDANVFQHMPYLQAAIDKRHYKIVSVGRTFVYPMGLYSDKIKRLSQVPTGAVVAIPNDPSNSARALLLLQSAGLIQLKANAPALATTAHILSNPKRLTFKEIDASQLPRVLADVDIAAINTNYAMLADLLPSRDALFIEKEDSPYANIIVVKQMDKADPRVQHLIDALHAKEVVEKAESLFQGEAIPAWK
jgi:D-methionine transport system substrate-binding protein